MVSQCESWSHFESRQQSRSGWDAALLTAHKSMSLKYWIKRSPAFPSYLWNLVVKADCFYKWNIEMYKMQIKLRVTVVCFFSSGSLSLFFFFSGEGHLFFPLTSFGVFSWNVKVQLSSSLKGRISKWFFTSSEASLVTRTQLGLGIFSHAQFFLGKAIDIDFAIKGNPIALGSKLRYFKNSTK